MTTALETDEASEKGPAFIYPLYPLAPCIEIVRAIAELGGSNAEVRRSILAAHIKVDERAQTLAQKLNAAKCFGLLSGRGPYSLTELAKRYFLPASESQKRNAGLEMLARPKAFAEIIKRFDGSLLPKNATLRNIIERETDVPESWRDRTVQHFLRSAHFVKAVDEQGFLRWSAGKSTDSTLSYPPMPMDNTPARTQSSDGSNLERPHEGNGELQNITKRIPLPSSNFWDFSHGNASIRLETPKELSIQLWNKLNQYVQLLKPLEDDKEAM